MILGLGCDIVQTERFKKDESYLLRFIEKYFTKKEIEEISFRCKDKRLEFFAQKVATRFAGKEAVSKALGSGFQNGIRLSDIEILSNDLGCPMVALYNKALERALLLSGGKQYNLQISLANEKDYVNAVAILESI